MTESLSIIGKPLWIKAFSHTAGLPTAGSAWHNYGFLTPHAVVSNTAPSTDTQA